MSGTQLHTLDGPQVLGEAQAPQSTDPPQPLETRPQFFPCCAQVVAVQPQTLGSPLAPQVSGAVHVPHDRVPPHPSATSPQFLARSAQVVGTHAASGVSLTGSSQRHATSDPKAMTIRRDRMSAILANSARGARYDGPT